MTKTEAELKKRYFTKDQKQEIEEGLRAGVDVAIYARRDFLAIQMRQIRLGLEEGLPVEKYAMPEYDWFQMEEIRNGLLDGVRIELFASPAISYDRMHQIRRGLREGIDLSPYKYLEAGILRELRYAILHKVNIVPYINAGYGTKQLAAIRKALEKGLEIDSWLKKEFRGISIEEICQGLEEGLDISLYARTEYCWQQMREIRLGLEQMIDVEQYRNPYYSWQQMREVRLGLEEGLDVSCYRSLMYTAKEMEKRREKLKENPAAFLQKEELQEEIPAEEVAEHCKIKVSRDEMGAYLELCGCAKDLSRTEILKALQQKGICFGIRYDDIDEIINGKKSGKKFLIAKGKKPRDGCDGWYEFFFRTQVARTPKELENGNVDYRNIEWFETVQKGQKLACYHNAEQGENGTTVTGQTVFAKRGREQSILTGSGFKRFFDGKTYYSDKQGIITLHDFTMEITGLLVMDEVNLATGDVNYEGNVLIQGNVSSGSKINTKGDLVVKGYVEASEISCGGNALLHQGMNGSGNGFIHAGKDVIGRFFEAVDIDAGGNIRGDYFLNCKLHAEEKVLISGKKSLLAGGSVHAEKGLQVSNLGNQAGIATYVKLGISEKLIEQEKELSNQIKNVEQELYILENAHSELKRKYPLEIRNTMELYLKIESAVYTKEKQMEELKEAKSKLADERRRSENVSAVISDRLFEGVTFEIGGARWESKSVENVMIRKSESKIGVFSNRSI